MLKAKLFSIFLLFQFLTTCLYGQCGEGLTITLSSQTQVDNFIDDYCTDFEGHLSIIDDSDGQDNILNLDALSPLQRVQGVFQIRNNLFLENLNGLNSITYIGALRIINNPSIEDLEGLNSLSTILGDLIINQNQNLENINALNALSTMISSSGYISIENNASLADISGLSNLSSLIGGLIVSGNGSLTSLNGLQNVKINVDSDSPIVDDVEIFNNLILDECSIQSICEALSSANVTFEIHSNGMNCASKDVIVSSCLTSTKDAYASNLKIYPNPFNDQLTIDSHQKDILNIYNSIGQLTKIITLKKGVNHYDFSLLQKGIYLGISQSGNSYRLMKE